MEIELIGTVSIYLGIGIQVLTALLLGGIVGLDREQKMKAAGLKTNILICIGAALYTTISMIVISDGAGGPVDPNRIGAQIVSGIGFLGAGAIMQGKGSVVGLTTAATIWVVAAIGYTVGAGYPFSATLFSLTVLLVLKIIRPFNGMFEKKRDYKTFKVEILSIGSVQDSIESISEEEKINIKDFLEEDIGDNKDRKIITFRATCHYRHIERFIGEAESLIKVEKTNFRSIKSNS
ncbi:MAG: MgtC/SapB family protein [Bacteriovoracaceae bacterium]|nr:MgtC/SapB family protein [Bacteriovoracaceae bacterium]